MKKLKFRTNNQQQPHFDGEAENHELDERGKPVFDRDLLEKAIQKAAPNLSKINDVDTWIDEIKSGTI